MGEWHRIERGETKEEGEREKRDEERGKKQNGKPAAAGAEPSTQRGASTAITHPDNAVEAV